MQDIPFVFAGKGPLEEEVNSVKNVKNVGFRTGNNLQTLIREAQFCVFPSQWYENCPFSVMETQTFGTPILASDLGGTPELIKDGVTGELFEGGKEEALQQKILKLWNDKERLEKYKENCKKVAFTGVEDYCEKLMEIYNCKE